MASINQECTTRYSLRYSARVHELIDLDIQSRRNRIPFLFTFHPYWDYCANLYTLEASRVIKVALRKFHCTEAVEW